MRDDRDDPEDRPDPEDLDERVAELEARVRDLRAELGRPPEGPLGLPRPPTPREVLSFTGEYAIPTAIAVLEANVRALEALQQVVRVLDPERSAAREGRDRLESRAADASRATLDRLESALEDVETTIRESDLPREGEARDILEEARRINREIRDRVEGEQRAADEARERARETDRERPDRGDDTDLEGGTTIELTDESDGEEGDGDGETAGDSEGDAGDELPDGRGEVDVEAELRSIKDEIESRERGEGGVDPIDGSEEADDEQVADESDKDDSDDPSDDA